MKRHRLAAVILLALAPPAFAQTPAPADPMAWAYGNTLEISVPTVGYVAKRHVDSDGTWRSKSNYGGPETGKWEVKDGKACFTQTDPVPEEGYRHICNDPVPRAVGDVWFSSDVVTGSLLRMEVIAGRK